MNIAIDIGHAHRTGARGLYEGAEIEEHALCTIIAPRVQELLKEAGHRVDIIDFPSDSNAVDLRKTIEAANLGGYDFGLSLHCDACSSPAAHGAHAIYVSARGRKLAEAIMRYLGNLLPGRADKTVERHDLAVLNRTRPVWVLVECGFITNKVDREMLRNAPHAIARVIVKGVLDYINHLEFA